MKKLILFIDFLVLFLLFSPSSIYASQHEVQQKTNDTLAGSRCENLGQVAQVCTGARDYQVLECKQAAEDDCQELLDKKDKLAKSCDDCIPTAYGGLIETCEGRESKRTAAEFDTQCTVPLKQLGEEYSKCRQTYTWKATGKGSCSVEGMVCSPETTAGRRFDVCRLGTADSGGQSTGQTKLSSADIKSFLDQLEKTEVAIDQCPPPRIPSESSCVAVKLPSLDIPSYVKDVDFRYVDSVVLKDAPSASIVSFSKDTNVPKSVDANKYGDPSNFILNPEIHIAKKTARSQFIFATVEAATSEVSTYQSTLGEGDEGSYSVFTIPRKEWASVENLVVLDKDAVNSNSYVKVGGPAVENITKMVLASDAKVTLANSTGKSVMEISNGARIVVAGTAADDTLEAARDLVSQLSNYEE